MEDYEYSGELPPKIKAMIRQFKLALVISGVFMVGVSAFLVFVIPRQNQVDPFPFLLIPLGAMMLSWGIIYFVVRKTILSKLYKAAQVMRIAESEPMVMRNLGVFETKGYLVGLYDRDSIPDNIPRAELPRPRVLIQARTNRKNAFSGTKNVPVNVWVDPQNSPPFVVLESEKQIFWGSISNRETRLKNTQSLKRTIFAIITMLVLLAAAFAIYQWQMIQEIDAETSLAMQSLEWPTTEAHIKESYIQKVRISKGKNKVDGFKAVVDYTYTVGGRSYKGNALHFCYNPTANPQNAEAIISQLPAGSNVRVAYEPEDPTVATLFPGYSDACEELGNEAMEALIGVSLICITMLLFMGVLFTFQYKIRAKLLRKVEEWGMP